MAIYHLSIQLISRSQGRSAPAAAAYRAAEKIMDIRTGELHDYTRKKGVDEKFILAPDSAPDWVFNREKLWNEVERVENRKNSRLAREINVALPTELNKTQQVELVREFVSDQFVNQGMIADVAFHDLNSHNPHAHILLTTRNIDPQGFSPNKNRHWDKRELLLRQRQAWAAHTNLALERAGAEIRIDHRSLEEQGLNRLPQLHLGANVAAMMKRGLVTDRGEQYLTIELANRQIATLERSITTLEPSIELERTTTTITLPEPEHTESTSQPSSDTTQYLTDAQLVEAIRQVQAWRQLKPFKPSLQVGKELDALIGQLTEQKNQLIKDIQAQKQLLQQREPRSIFNPFGTPRLEYENQLRDLELKQQQFQSTSQRLKDTTFQFSNWQREAQAFLAWRNTKSHQLESLLSSPTYQKRVELIQKGYDTYGAAQYILEHQGQTTPEHQLRYFQGQTYRIEQKDTTITIFHKEQSEPLYTATDNREEGGIIHIHQFNLKDKDKKILLDYAQHLAAERQRQHQQERSRGFSLER